MGAGKPLAIDLFCGLGGWTDGLLENPRAFSATHRADLQARKPRRMTCLKTEHWSRTEELHLVSRRWDGARHKVIAA